MGVLYHIGVGVEESRQAELACFEGSFSLYLVLFEDACEGSVFPAISAISVLLSVVETALVSAQLVSIGVHVHNFALLQLIGIPQSLVNERGIVGDVDLLEPALSMPYVILPLPDVLSVAKYELSIPTFLILQPASLIVHMRVFIKINSLL